MFVEIKPLANLGLISARKEADSQMRQRFTDFYDAAPTIFTGIIESHPTRYQTLRIMLLMLRLRSVGIWT